MFSFLSLDKHRPQKLVWHGADKLGIRNSDAYCEAWDSSHMQKVGLASSILRGKLLDQERYSCNNAFIVLCIEVASQDAGGHSGHNNNRRRRQAISWAVKDSRANQTTRDAIEKTQPYKFISLLNEENELN